MPPRGSRDLGRGTMMLAREDGSRTISVASGSAYECLSICSSDQANFSDVERSKDIPNLNALLRTEGGQFYKINRLPDRGRKGW